LIENIGNLSPKIIFLLTSPNNRIGATFIHDFTDQRSSSDEPLGALLLPNCWWDYYWVDGEELIMEYDVVVVENKGRQ